MPSEQYQGPFVLSEAAYLRVVAYSADFFDSDEGVPVRIDLPPLHFLSTASTGGGSVSVMPPGPSYIRGESVQLQAQPLEGWTFLEWRGDITGTNPAITIEMTRDKCIQAIFGTTITTTAAGDGRIVLDPPGGLYPWNTPVRLYAVPRTNSYFVLWGNGAAGSTNPLLLAVTEPEIQISSAFYPLASNQVTLTVLPEGEGVVMSQPQTNRYARGQVVQITAMPNEGQTFLGWDGDFQGTEPVANITLNISKFVRARFSQNPRLLLAPCDPSGSGGGYYGALQGSWGAQYQILVSSNLQHWKPVTTLINRFGVSQYIDSSATNRVSRFYRAVLIE
jgi:NOL1/NOP2/fmu family ribosome biogenesis protein